MPADLKWPEREAYEYQLGRPIEELYEDIGFEHWSHMLDKRIAGEKSPEGMANLDTGAGQDTVDDVATGKRVFERVLPDIRRALCDEWKLCDRLAAEERFKDEVQLAAAITDVIIASVAGLGLPVIVISVLVVKIGVRRLCGCQ